MRNQLMLVMCGLLVAGCSESAPPPSPAIQASKHVVEQSATQPSLQAIDVHYGIYLARIENHITVAPTGLLRSATTYGKSYGPTDTVTGQWTEIREGQLTQGQMAELAELFVGWDSLSDSYGGGPDGPEIEFRYGNKVVRGGSQLPRQVFVAYQRVKALGDSMPHRNPTTQGK